MSEDENVDFYQVLGVDQGATTHEITHAYYRLAKKMHPDKRPDDKDAASKFNAIKQAHEALTNEETRRIYDQKHVARLQKRKREQALDEELRQARINLETREKASKQQRKDVGTVIHVERVKDKLREETLDMRLQMEREEQQRLKRLRQHQQKAPVSTNTNSLHPTSGSSSEIDGVIKIKWRRGKKSRKAKRESPEEQWLRKIFSVFGEIESITIRKKTALLRFVNPLSLIQALQQTNGIIDSEDEGGDGVTFAPLSYNSTSDDGSESFARGAACEASQDDIFSPLSPSSSSSMSSPWLSNTRRSHPSAPPADEALSPPIVSVLATPIESYDDLEARVLKSMQKMAEKQKE